MTQQVSKQNFSSAFQGEREKKKVFLDLGGYSLDGMTGLASGKALLCHQSDWLPLTPRGGGGGATRVTSR